MFDMQELNLVILGAKAVGKTALVLLYLYGRFVSDYDTTIEDFYSKKISYNSMNYMLSITDTGSHESLRDAWIENAGGYIIIYSATDNSTFHYAEQLLDRIFKLKSTKTTSVPCVLVQNKIDLQHGTSGENLARQYDCGYFETSAKTKVRFREPFDCIVSRMCVAKPKGKNGKIKLG